MRFKDEKGKLIKSIVLVLCILCVAMVIIAVQFAEARYMITKSYETELYFYEYRIKETEIVLSTEKYTGEDITVEIKTQISGLSIQYQLGDDGEWIDYVGPFSVSKNVKLNTRLVSDEDGFISSVTSKEIKNIAVAKIGDEYFKTLAAAIDACAENAGDNKTKIEMLINVKENIVIPEGKNIELDLCGVTLEGKDSKDETITVSGKFTLIDSAQNEDGTLQGNGKVLSAGAEAVHVLANGEFVLGTNESATGANEEISIINPVIEGKTYGVKIEDNGNFKFYDGIIIGVDEKSISGEVAETPIGYRVVNGTKKIDGTTYETSYLDNTYHVTFDENYENAKTIKKDIKYNTAIGELSEPTREKYIFDGWYTAKTGGEKITKETVITEDTTFYAYWLEVVASTTIGDVTTNYASVQQAINAAGTNAGAVVKLLKEEIAENVTVAAGQNMVLDLNGKRLNNKAATYTLINRGELLVTGEGTLFCDATVATIKSYGISTVDGDCTIVGTNRYPISNEATFILNKGTIKGEFSAGISNYPTGTVEVNGGVIEAVSEGINSQGIVVISDGEISGNNGIYSEGNGTITITGGKITGNSTGVVNGLYNGQGGTVTMTGGIVKGKTGIKNYANLEISGGTVVGDIYAITINNNAVLTIGINEENPSVDTMSPVIISKNIGIYKEVDRYI